MIRTWILALALFRYILINLSKEPRSGIMTGKIQCVIFDLDGTIVNLGDFVDWQAAKESAYECYLGNGVSIEILDSSVGKKDGFS